MHGQRVKTTTHLALISMSVLWAMVAVTTHAAIVVEASHAAAIQDMPATPHAQMSMSVHKPMVACGW